MKSLNSIGAEISFGIVIGVFVTHSALLGEEEPSPPTVGLKQAVEALVEATDSTTARRISFYVEMEARLRSSSLGVFVSPSECGDYEGELKEIDAMVQISRNSDTASRRKLLRSVNNPKSLSRATIAAKLIESNTRDPVSRNRILELEPFWVPALRDVYMRDGRHWMALSAPLYAGNFVDISDPDSPDGLLIRKQLCRAIDSVSNSENPELGDALRYLNRKVSGKPMWVGTEADRRKVIAILKFYFSEADDAIGAYQEIVELGEARASTYYRLAKLYLGASNSERARSLIEEGLTRADGRVSLLLVESASGFIDTGEIVKAEDRLKECLRNSPEYPPAHLALARIALLKGDIEGAITSCSDAAAFGYGWGESFARDLSELVSDISRTRKR